MSERKRSSAKLAAGSLTQRNGLCQNDALSVKLRSTDAYAKPTIQP